MNGKNPRFGGQRKTLRIHVRARLRRELGHTTATVSIANVHFPNEIKCCESWEDALEIMHVMWNRKVWNASWFCIKCWQCVYQNECCRKISLEEVREKLGIAKQLSSEIARRQKRTKGGTQRNNPQPSRHLQLPPPKRARLYV